MSESYRQRIKQVIIREANLTDMTPDDIGDDDESFGEDIGLDSLDALQITTGLEEEFGVEIPEGDESKDIFRSVASLEAFPKKQAADT